MNSLQQVGVSTTRAAHQSGVVLSAAGQEATALTQANAPLGRPSTADVVLVRVAMLHSRRADGPNRPVAKPRPAARSSCGI